MRQLKTMLRARKAQMLGCGDCECRTLLARKCANENCNCGENKSGLPNYVRLEGNSETGGLIQFFNESDEQSNAITLEIDTDTGGVMVSVGEFGIIEDEGARALWVSTWESLDAEAVAKLFGMDENKEGVWHFTSEAMAQFNAFVNNPTEEQAQILRERLEDKASDEYDPPHYPIVIFDE